MKMIKNDTGYDYIIGIDAGAKGYMALINANNMSVLRTIPIPSETIIVKEATFKVDKTRVYKRGEKKGQYFMKQTKCAVKEGVIQVRKLQDTVCNLFQVYEKKRIKVVIEKQSGGGFVGSQTSKDTMMKNYGRLISLFELSNTSYEEVTPRVWKRDLDIELSTERAKHLSANDRTKTRKKMSMDLFQKIFGYEASIHDEAEASLIAYWWLQKNNG